MTSRAADRVIQAQNDTSAMNQFIEENRKFIKACAYHAVHHFVNESDDEWSVALIAFHEAVQSYDESKGDFRAFAQMVIRRRLTDYIRSEARHSGEILVSPGSMDGEVEDSEEMTAVEWEVQKKAVDLSLEKDRGSSRATVKDEIEAVQQILSRYGFSFFDLADCSPKADKTKRSCAEAVAALLRDDALYAKMQRSRTLPIAELAKKAGVHKKILERHRKYIIAAAEILNGEYPLLAEYMNYIRKALDP